MCDRLRRYRGYTVYQHCCTGMPAPGLPTTGCARSAGSTVAKYTSTAPSSWHNVHAACSSCVKTSLLSYCFTCLSFTKFFFLATFFFFDRHARRCVRRVVVENRAFAIVFKATAARRAVSALQMAFQNRSKNNARLRREGSSLASEFVHPCSWRYPATRQIYSQLRTCSIGRFLPGPETTTRKK